MTRSAKFHIGTSGWQYDDWHGRFYPEDLAKSHWLDYYVQQFPTVELNNSFYRQPTAASWKRWRETAPDGFCFAVKASRFLTHIKRLKQPEQPLKRLFDGAERLEDRLGPVLYQLPPTFKRTEENAERLEHFLSALPARHDHVIEFRHPSWFGDETLSALRKHGVAFCVRDMDQKHETPVVATAAFAYVRFHGSEAKKYQGKYTDHQLEAWAGKLSALARETDAVWAFFNNDTQGYAVDNARQLTALLS
jgi:uncharacterized protein YecE (DUF72 family)